jgi:hypothetical protein
VGSIPRLLSTTTCLAWWTAVRRSVEPATGGEKEVVSEVCNTEELFEEEGQAERLTGGDKIVGKVVVVLFTHGWGKVKIRPAGEVHGDEVRCGRRRKLARILLWPWSKRRSSEVACHWSLGGAAMTEGKELFCL